MTRIDHARRCFLAATGGTILAGCIGGSGDDSSGSTADGEPDVGSVTLLLNWRMSGLHAPYVAARENGFYEDEGFQEVTIESGDGSDFAANQAGLENVEFAITSSDQLLNVNSRGLSPRCVAVVMQRNPNVVFATRDGFGELTEPAQLEGATVGSGPGMVRQMTQAYLEHHDVLETVEYVDTGFDTVQQLLAGDIDAAGGVFGDVVDAEQQGGTVDTLSIDETIPSYGHLVATGAEFATTNETTVRSFLRATARGAVWASNNPDAAVDLLIEVQPELETVRENQLDKWNRMRSEYMQSDSVAEHGWGWNEPSPWERTYDTLEAADVFENDVDPETVWTNDYLDDADEYIADYAELVET
ncbi:ABC transporter substrate-binding protein [Natronorubrum thiooxidans]|uniref:Thiamine pyrimidine synthase n=1 Tax=Natronorubrum thiooxidans TaxID=308853 RepID=A0A1N7D918_9EURY|nr:ABC transporter substrate-binding protein [Natronorubrum thiooxidans]SIR72321.1 NitT/TauT family transport system substrate-binding protein [Natronorubrum thiooxidans]